ncbi:MAG: cytochrome C [Betaproteobacteria bacterium HGW-Betaproteobacteria-22]|nr:MAG: cytochrome C [Betaproteobacteria bacterium HGW-Betaproteobacteria-22]
MLGNKTLKSTLLVSIFALAGLVSVSAYADITLVATQDGAPLNIKKELFDTPAAKEFLATGKNPYIGNEDMIKAGKKKYNLYSCNACHGGVGEGAVAPGLQGPTFKYAKNATNKGMFETIWHGTNGGMGAKGLGLMVPDDPTEGLKPDDILKVQAWIRSHSKITGNE